MSIIKLMFFSAWFCENEMQRQYKILFLVIKIGKLTRWLNLHSFVNISPTVIIDTSMERSSLVLQHGNLKI